MYTVHQLLWGLTPVYKMVPWLGHRRIVLAWTEEGVGGQGSPVAWSSSHALCCTTAAIVDDLPTVAIHPSVILAPS